MLCAFFKQGQCQKGDKCKFSHDVTIERKAEKRSIYSDVRDEDLENGELIDKELFLRSFYFKLLLTS